MEPFAEYGSLPRPTPPPPLLLGRRRSSTRKKLLAAAACVCVLFAGAFAAGGGDRVAGNYNEPPSSSSSSSSSFAGLLGSGRRRTGRRTDFIRATRGNVLGTDCYITPNDTLVSQNGFFHANLSWNGIFRIYRRNSFNGERVIYELGTPPIVQTQMGFRPGKRAEGNFFAMLINDGNLLIHKGTDPRHRLNLIDSSKIKSKRKGQYRGVLENDGSFIVYNETNHPLWWSRQSTLYMKDFIEEGDVLVSQQGKFFATLTNESLQTFEGYGPSDPNKTMNFEWKVNKNRLPKRKGTRLFGMIQENGDFQIYSATSPEDKIKTICMRSRTGGLKKQAIDNYIGMMEDKGEFVLYGGKGMDVANFQRQWGSYEACLHPAEVAFSNTVNYLPVMGPIYKEFSAFFYSFKPWCKPMAKQRMNEGLKSLGLTLGFTVVPYTFKMIQQIQEKGWKSVLRVKTSSMDKTHYEILGIERDASEEEIKAAYLKHSSEIHPDKFTDPVMKRKNHEVYRKMTLASEILLNDQKRRNYDGELPMFDFTSAGQFWQTLNIAVQNCLGIRSVMEVQKEVDNSAFEDQLD